MIVRGHCTVKLLIWNITNNCFSGDAAVSRKIPLSGSLSLCECDRVTGEGCTHSVPEVR